MHQEHRLSESVLREVRETIAKEAEAELGHEEVSCNSGGTDGFAN